MHSCSFKRDVPYEPYVHSTDIARRRCKAIRLLRASGNTAGKSASHARLKATDILLTHGSGYLNLRLSRLMIRRRIDGHHSATSSQCCWLSLFRESVTFTDWSHFDYTGWHIQRTRPRLSNYVAGGITAHPDSSSTSIALDLFIAGECKSLYRPCAIIVRNEKRIVIHL